MFWSSFFDSFRTSCCTEVSGGAGKALASGSCFFRWPACCAFFFPSGLFSRILLSGFPADHVK
ncbi:MAG TPA: hypothetical protein DDW86_01320, partial [Clostridiales bacterium]|nr:hypothetical protein [Clostridiales bacterium]